MNEFIGIFFCVTNYSIFKVEVRNLTSSPIVMKMRIMETGRQLTVPVGGTILGGFYLAITCKGLWKYQTVPHQRAPDEVRPPLLEDIRQKSRRRMKTWPPVGLFLKRDDADQCLVDARDAKAFDRLWAEYSLKVLKMIGPTHPLITISCKDELALPKHIVSRLPWMKKAKAS